MFGILNINKPALVTSRDVVNRLCKSLALRQVGHAGTLDPMATGVLAVCVGPATRLVSFVQQLPKTYVADFRLGVESSTEDVFGQLTELEHAPELSRSSLLAILPSFVGQISQVPPAFSALKLGGKPAYKLARRGKQVNLAARPVTIHELELLEFAYPEFRLRIKCGAGTYVRSLGRDIARMAGSGALMTKLVRTAIGRFSIQDSVSLDTVCNAPLAHLLSPLVCLHELPRFIVDAEQIEQIHNGRFLKQTLVARQVPISESTTTLIATDSAQRLIAVLERFDRNNFKPKINFAQYWRDNK